MVAIYVLKLEGGKYYVGMTRRNIDRVLDHIDGKGAAWTRKYPPSDSKPIVSFQENLRESDENRITLEMMAKYGIRNVRGGDWCKVRMPHYELRELERRVGKKSSKNPKTKNSEGFCICCGDRKKYDFDKPLCRECYYESESYDYWEDEWDAEEGFCHKCGKDWETSVDAPLCISCWKKSVKKEAPAKNNHARKKTKRPQKNIRCKARTMYGQGPRCKLTSQTGSDYCRVHAPYYR